jgi:uncharacterized protein YjcR
MRLYESNLTLPEWHHPDEWIGVRRLADQFGVSKSTIHRWVNRDALANDRLRSKRRRLRAKAGLGRR